MQRRDGKLEQSQMWLSISMPRDKGQKNVRNFQSASFRPHLSHPSGFTPQLSWMGIAAFSSRLGLVCCPLHYSPCTCCQVKRHFCVLEGRWALYVVLLVFLSQGHLHWIVTLPSHEKSPMVGRVEAEQEKVGFRCIMRNEGRQGPTDLRVGKQLRR